MEFVCELRYWINIVVDCTLGVGVTFLLLQLSMRPLEYDLAKLSLFLSFALIDIDSCLFASALVALRKAAWGLLQIISIHGARVKFENTEVQCS